VDVDETPPREWDWISAWLLFLLLQVATVRLITTDWAPFLYFSETLAGLGTILGLALGASRFGRRSVIILASTYTLVVIPWQLAGAVDDKLLTDRLVHTGGILLASLAEFLRGQPVKDALFFVAFICLVFWVISVLAGYWLARTGRILGSILLSGAAIILIQAYADYQPHGSWWLAVYLMLAFLLVGRGYFLESRKDWSRRRVFVSEEAWPSISWGLFVTGSAAILVAWNAPASPASLHSAADWWNRFSQPMRESLSNAVTSLSGPYGKPGSNFYGSSLSMGQNAASGDSAVFTVEVLKGVGSTPRYYWRGRVYDQYLDGRWSTASASSLVFEPTNDDLGIPDAGGRSEVQLRFTSEFPKQSLIYAPSQPVWIDRPANLVAARPASNQFDVLSWDAQTALVSGGQYEVRSELANPEVEQLSAAAKAYPQWIQDRYLDVPVSQRAQMRALAETISAGQSNPYDKAAAITAYLRAEIQYTTSVPSPPAGQDPVAWVLFDYKKGFCNYYASAEVLLLRSVGIPARLAVGFAQGELQNGAYVVRRRDAHAWPEVYFPGFGWVEFEPTANQSPLVRPSAAPLTNPNPFVRRPTRALDGEEGAGPTVGGTTSKPPTVPLDETPQAQALMIAVTLLSLGALAYLGSRFHLWARVPAYVSKTLQHSGIATPAWVQDWIRWNRLQPVERSFASINWSLRWLGQPPPVNATPAERARALSSLLPLAAEHIDALKSELESGLFTRQPADLPRARRAGFYILLHLIRARLSGRLGDGNGRDVYSE
jgi:transglutaminase-like putative cysteine protease